MLLALFRVEPLACCLSLIGNELAQGKILLEKKSEMVKEIPMPTTLRKSSAMAAI
jgi:hypothetical protein